MVDQVTDESKLTRMQLRWLDPNFRVYMKDYRRARYQNDPEYRERMKAKSRLDRKKAKERKLAEQAVREAAVEHVARKGL